MKKLKCPICQKELEQDRIQCPYCKYRFKIVPKRVNSPEDEKTRLDGYLVSDIRDCLVHIEEDTLVLLWIINPTTNLSINEFSASRTKLLLLMETVML
mgnify:CR=1 FL=1